MGAIFHNPISKGAILKHWNINEAQGYYLAPRNKELPYAGWRSHHTKEFSKVDKSVTLLYEFGELPKDKRGLQASETEKKETTDVVLRKMRKLLEDGDDGKECFELYPRNYVLYGEATPSQ